MSGPKTVIAKIFQDNNDQVVIFQWPNLPLWGWIICRLLAMMVAKGRLRDGPSQLASAFLFVWAYLEITEGVNYFRKSLGITVIALLAYSFFN